MKYRKSFVTNSSSSSFIIAKKYLNEQQIEAIRDHSFLGQKLGLPYANESWDIEEDDEFITGSTYMDNFDIFEIFEKYDIPFHIVACGMYPFHLDSLTPELKETLNNPVKYNK